MTAAVGYHLCMAFRAGTDICTVDHHKDLVHLFSLNGIAVIGSAPEIADMCKILCLPAVGQISGESDAVESFRKDVSQKPLDKFDTGNNQSFLPAIVGIVSIGNGYVFIIDIEDA